MLHGGAGYLKGKLVGTQGTGAPGVKPFPADTCALHSRAAWHCQVYGLGVAAVTLLDPAKAALLRC